MEIDSHHVHRAMVSLFTKIFDNVFIKVILYPFDHGYDILFILSNKMFVEHLWFILGISNLFHLFDFQKVLLFDSLL